MQVMLEVYIIPRKSAKTDIIVDTFYPIRFIEELSDEAKKKTEEDSKKRYKSITVSLDILNATKLSTAIDNVIHQLDELNDKVTLTIFVEKDSINKKLRMTVTADKH